MLAARHDDDDDDDDQSIYLVYITWNLKYLQSGNSSSKICLVFPQEANFFFLIHALSIFRNIVMHIKINSLQNKTKMNITILKIVGISWMKSGKNDT